MNIHVHCISYNEEKIMPYFIEHYSRFCSKIFVWDNYSTDSTPNIVAKHSPKTQLISWKSGEINELNYINLKQNCRNYSLDADYVIVVDCDEFLDVDVERLKQLKKLGVTLPFVHGMEMLCRDFDFKSDISSITSYLPKENLCKRCIFSPTVEMVWDVGCHPSVVGKNLLKNVKGIVEHGGYAIPLRHYKWINIDYVINRYASYAARLSNFNKQYKLGFHYTKSPKEIIEEYNSMELEAHKNV